MIYQNYEKMRFREPAHADFFCAWTALPPLSVRLPAPILFAFFVSGRYFDDSVAAAPEPGGRDLSAGLCGNCRRGPDIRERAVRALCFGAQADRISGAVGCPDRLNKNFSFFYC
ncbi:hypothetical protein [uncultured Alistipes sp.]|uniref:hypothetical protein n=1 Tax=uncultured Alistipes sp. TaxID=538949 RepID=UPI00266D820E|nr:hypothetical protein [uncultured Alistipes sp.]